MNKIYSTLTLLLLSTIFSVAGDFDFAGGLPKADRIDEAEGRQRIQAFRNFRFHGDFALEFQLEHFSRRAYGDIYNGRLWATYNSQGPLVRVMLWPRNGEGEKLELISQNGPNPKMWIKNGSSPVREITTNELLAPFYKDIVYTPFDLSLRFLFWNDFKYHGPGRERSRAVHLFTMSPPPSVQEVLPELKSIRLAMDEKYNAPLQAEYLGVNDKVLKSLVIRSFKQVQGQFLAKHIDVTDNSTKSKTRFEILAAAMNIEFDHDSFTPDALGTPPPVLPSEYFSRL